MSERVAYVGVIGASDADDALAALAEGVGRALGRAGAALVCGGLGGVMEAACRGAREEGGLTIGLLPGSDRGGANPWVQVALPTGMGELRNGLIVRAADVLVAVGGGYGTLSEIAFALRAGKPVVGLGALPLGPEQLAAVELAEDPEDAVLRALAAAGG
ncbi:MAG TPA: TIGR00725 family protein [Solirubrobacteraceae bacterium]|nr:TIGR00725 family protein [Solirubrobacteraceae bacterium]